MKPVIALVGRPNVGKSTLFNRLTKSRDAIVADFAGLTRDRHYGDGRVGGREFIVVDTGGFEPDKPTGIVKEMAKQTEQAVAEADAVIFVVDVRAGAVGAGPRHRALPAHAPASACVLAANKAEGMSESPLLAEFYELGLGEPHPVSAAHGQGVAQPGRGGARARLRPRRRRGRGRATGDADAADPPRRRRPAERRQVDADQHLARRGAAGRLRPAGHDARRDPSCRSSATASSFELIDTAGLRRKGKVFEAIEKFSVVKTLQAIAEANVVLLLLDATQGVTDQDAHIAGYILESGRAVVRRGQQVGRGRRLPARDAAALDRAAPGVPEVRAGAAHLGDQAPGPRPGVEGDRRRARVGDAQDADAGADAAAAGGGRSTRRPSAPARSGPSCATRTRAA